MDDLISRALALEVINAVKGVVWSQSGKVLCGKIFSQIKDLPAVNAVPVVRCKDCQHCRLLNDGVSFECTSWEMDFYAPEYSAATYYCADGKRREEHGDKASDGE